MIDYALYFNHGFRGIVPAALAPAAGAAARRSIPHTRGVEVHHDSRGGLAVARPISRLELEIDVLYALLYTNSRSDATNSHMGAAGGS